VSRTIINASTGRVEEKRLQQLNDSETHETLTHVTITQSKARIFSAAKHMQATFTGGAAHSTDARWGRNVLDHDAGLARECELQRDVAQVPRATAERIAFPTTWLMTAFLGFLRCHFSHSSGMDSMQSWRKENKKKKVERVRGRDLCPTHAVNIAD
jgi:hypothetical protein